MKSRLSRPHLAFLYQFFFCFLWLAGCFCPPLCLLSSVVRRRQLMHHTHTHSTHSNELYCWIYCATKIQFNSSRTSDGRPRCIIVVVDPSGWIYPIVKWPFSDICHAARNAHNPWHTQWNSTWDTFRPLSTHPQHFLAAVDVHVLRVSVVPPHLLICNVFMALFPIQRSVSFSIFMWIMVFGYWNSYNRINR